MLQLYDLNKVKIKGLKLYKDYKVESVLSSGDKVLSFLYPARLSKELVEECYIRTKTDEFVVKEISDSGDWKSIKATMNVETLEGQPWEHFDTTEQTVEQCLTLACAGTGWTVQVNGVAKKRTIRKTNCSTWDIIQQAKKTYRVEIEFDTINKIVKVAEKLGSYKGAYFMDSLNLRNLDIQSNSYDFYTRLIAIGKDDLKVTVENFQYSSKIKTLIWKDERYTDITSLTEDATAKLEEISKPYRSYGADIIDLASLSEKYNILAYSLGDTITLISKEKGIKEKQRIVKITEYPEEPNRNTCEIANTLLTFEDMQKEQQDTTDTVNNITSDNGTISEGAIQTAVEHLTINKADITSLNASNARIGTLEATTATITQLNAVNATISNLQVDKANVTDLTASTGRITVLESSVGDIQTLVNGNLTSANIQSLMLTSDKVTVANGFIKDAMIDTLSVSKILAGDISTSKFRIISDSGNMLISDNTIQISDASRVRVQIGKDASNDYNMYIWDSTGKLMFDATGLKADGIKTKIIRDDMVSDTANINGSKLNIATVVTSINGGATTLNSSKVLLDGTTQTLNVAFNNLSTKVDSAPPTVITDSSITKLTGAIDGMLKINSIKGRTLQNLSPKTLSSTTKTSDGYFTSTIPTWDYLTTDMKMFKPNTTYTMIFEVVTNTFSNPIGLTTSTSTSIWSSPNTINKDFIGVKIFTVKTKADFTGCSYGFWMQGGNPTTATGGFKLRIIILEGDYTNKPIPYFDNIRSVAETGENLEVVSCDVTLLEESRQTLPLTEPLRGLPNGVTDTVDFERGITTKNVGKIVLNGSESWAQHSNTLTNTAMFTLPLTNKTNPSIVNLICDKFSPNIASNIYNIDVEGCYVTADTLFVIRINKSKLATQDLAGFKAWLQANPVTVYYQLATPIETSIEVIQYMKQFKDGNLIVDGSLINPTVDFTYSTSLASATSMAREVIESNTTAINVQQGEISTLISNTTIIKDGITTQLKDAYNSTVATVNSLSTTINDHTSTINTLTGEVSSVTTRTSTLETNLSGITGRVTNVETTTSDHTTRLSTAESKLTATSLTTTISTGINSGTSSIATTQFVMDSTGFTIKNGALKILNKAGSTVLCGDSDGNLQIGGNTADGSLVVRDASNNKIININKYGAEFANGFIKMTAYNAIGTIGNSGSMQQFGTKQHYDKSGTEVVGDGGYRYWDVTTANYGYAGADIETYTYNTSGTLLANDYRCILNDRKLEFTYKQYTTENPGKTTTITPGELVVKNALDAPGESRLTPTDLYLGSYSKNTSGYTKLSNGHILQWGYFTMASGTESISNGLTFITKTLTFPISFPNAAFIVIPISVSRECIATSIINTKSTAKIEVTKHPSANSTTLSTGAVYWVAIGY